MVALARFQQQFSATVLVQQRAGGLCAEQETIRKEPDQVDTTIRVMSEKELHLKSMEKRRLSSNTTQPSATLRKHAAREVARLQADFHKVYGDFQVELASSPIEEQEVIALRYLSRCVDLHGKWLEFAVPVRDGMKLYVEFLEYAIQTYLLPEIERLIRPVFGDDGAARVRVMIEGHKNQWIASMKKARFGGRTEAAGALAGIRGGLEGLAYRIRK